MARQMREKSASQIYHVMLRGNERKNIFADNEDRERFIAILKRKAKESGYILYGYYLMDNHVHIVLNEGNEGISKVMKRINVSYAQYFNTKYKRVGHLFQDRFKSEAIEDNLNLLAVLRYIHRNPVKAGMVTKVEDYQWSSFNSYIKDDGEDAKGYEDVLNIYSSDKEKARKLYIELLGVDRGEGFIEYEDHDKERKKEQEEAEAERMINEFLEKEDLYSKI
ncbi:MAG: transposase [Firmicutes bacterium]|nr:transposase [Bacillota bacterium]